MGILVNFYTHEGGVVLKNYRIGILGATGAVGRTMLQVLEERMLPIASLRLFASEKSTGKMIKFRGRALVVEKIEEDSFDELDIILGALDADLSRKYWPMIEKSHALYIDNSSAFRLDPSVPLVIPEINKEDAFHHHGIIANPNCATIIALMAIAPIHRLSPVCRLIVSTYQAVSGAGSRGIQELQCQQEALIGNQAIQCDVFPYPIINNVIPIIGEVDASGNSREENKLCHEGRKILHYPDLQVNCTCVRVPVKRCHCESITFELKQEISLSMIQEALQRAPGIIYDETLDPTPLAWQDQDKVYVGRLRQDPDKKNCYMLWCCGDQLRKGAASNAIDILETVMQS